MLAPLSYCFLYAEASAFCNASINTLSLIPFSASRSAKAKKKSLLTIVFSSIYFQCYSKSIA